MKKALSISLLLLLALNWFLYRALFIYSVDRAQSELQTLVDENRYNPEELITFKVAVENSYFAGSERYESIEGSVEANGTTYQFIKKRVYNDTLEVVCLPNHKQTDLKNMDLELQKQLLEFAHTGSGKSKRASLPSWWQDLSHGNTIEFSLLGAHLSTRLATNLNFSLSEGFLSSLVKPPLA